MTEEAFFLQVLADHLKRRKTASAPDGLDWDKLAALARRHQVSGMLYSQCQSFWPAEKAAGLKQAYFYSVMAHTNRNRDMSDIGKAFETAGISYFTVKGLEVAALYPVPALRTMGDCDIVVHPENKERAHQTLLALGFENRTQQGMEWTYCRNRLEYELHDHLLYDETVNS